MAERPRNDGNESDHTRASKRGQPTDEQRYRAKLPLEPYPARRRSATFSASTGISQQLADWRRHGLGRRTIGVRTRRRTAATPIRPSPSSDDSVSITPPPRAMPQGSAR